MTDDAKPAHPPPWRWVAPDVGEPDRGFLVDANGARVLSIALGHDPGDETILPASPVVRALTELAPEAAELLVEAVGWLHDPSGFFGGGGEEEFMPKYRALLAKLDEARKASR